MTWQNGLQFDVNGNLLVTGLGGSSGSVIPNAAYNGTTDDFAAFQAFITAAGSTQTTAVISGPMLIGSNLIIPPTMALQFTNNGLLKPAANKTITINGAFVAGPWQVFDASASGAVVTGLMKPIGGRLYTEHFGAVGDGTTDDSNAFQLTAKAAADAGSIGIQLLSKTYKVIRTIYADGSDNQNQDTPSWYGSSAFDTTVFGSGMSNNDPIFQFRGGAGQYIQAGVYDIGFLGDGNAPRGVCFKNKGSTWCYRCRFDTVYSAICIWNADTGAYTEFCGGDNCWIRSNYTFAALEYRFTAGASPSCRGSGFRNSCLFGIPTNGAGVSIPNGLRPYSSPMDIELSFGNAGPYTLIANNTTTAPPTFFGTIRGEPNNGLLTLATTNRVWFAGHYEFSSDQVTAGKMMQVRAIIVNSNSSISPIGLRQGGTMVIAAGANIVVTNLATTRMYDLRIVGTTPTYNYYVLLHVIPSGTGSAGQVEVINSKLFADAGGIGAPSFTVNTSDQLVITNANFAGTVNAYWEETQTGLNNTSFHITV